MRNQSASGSPTSRLNTESAAAGATDGHAHSHGHGHSHSDAFAPAESSESVSSLERRILDAVKHGEREVLGISHVRIHFFGAEDGHRDDFSGADHDHSQTADAAVQMEIRVDDSLSVRAAGSIALRVRRLVEAVEGVRSADIHLEVNDLEACRFVPGHEEKDAWNWNDKGEK